MEHIDRQLRVIHGGFVTFIPLLVIVSVMYFTQDLRAVAFTIIGLCIIALKDVLVALYKIRKHLK